MNLNILSISNYNFMIRIKNCLLNEEELYNSHKINIKKVKKEGIYLRRL